LCERATVLRNGAVTGVADARTTSSHELARMMVGSELPRTIHPPSTPSPEPVLEVRDLTAEVAEGFGVSLRDVSLSVRAGEIVGIAGVSGNGQAELISYLSGETLHDKGDTIRLLGQPAGHLDPAKRRQRGLAFVPEERLGRGAVPTLSLQENAVLTGHRRGMVRYGLLDRRKAADFADRVIKRFSVKARNAQSAAQSLSGGNLQKFIVGREIELEPKVLLVSQPTWGVDVGAAAFIRQTLIDISRQGTAVLVVSEELDELFEICDRLVVMCAGGVSRPLETAETNREEVGLLMTGLDKTPESRKEADLALHD